MKNTNTQLNNHRGQFKSIVVDRVKGGVECFSGKIKKVTDQTMTFWTPNGNKSVTVFLKNVVSVS